MTQQSHARITGLGSYVPDRILTNKDLEKVIETTDEWIVTRTGMKERRIAAPEEATSDMALEAAKRAMATAGTAREDIDFIIVTTMSPDYLAPSTACLVQKGLGCYGAAAMDIQAACTGFLYGLSIAKAYIQSGMAKKVLVIASEKMSSVVDYTDRNTCVLFGDGASAAVVENEGEGLSIDTVCLGADGAQSELILIPAGGSRCPATEETVAQKLHTIKMQGKEVFKHAVRRMAGAVRNCLEEEEMEEENISWLVPHQANLRIMEAISKNFSIPEERVYKTVHKYGNTSASSIAIALDELIRDVEMKQGERILLVAFGAGLTWGASVLTKL